MLPYQFAQNWERVLFRKQVTPAHSTDHYVTTKYWLENRSPETFYERAVSDATTIGFNNEALVFALVYKTFMHYGVYNGSDDSKYDQNFLK